MKEAEIVDSTELINEISNFVFTSKYARYNAKKKRRETWNEAVDRLESMHLKKYAWLDEKDKTEIKKAFDFVRSKHVVPSMRSLQFGGKPIETKNERMFNCSVRHIDSTRSFAEVMFMLLAGNGVGLGLSKHFLNRLPDLVTAEDKTGTVITYVIEDTIEGWSDAVEALLNCYFRNTAYSGRKIVFDYSKIRKKGAPIKTGGGKAPGYKGLKQSLGKIKHLLDYIIEHKHQTRMKSINAYDIIMHCADAVLSGGIRRSATSVVFDKDDEDMLEAKTGEWFKDNPQRGRSNNSILLVREETTLEEFKKIVERTKQFGEPGFVWANKNAQHILYNPCFEISFIPVTDDGICGAQFCNLTSQNGAKITSKEIFKETTWAATVIGTLQAGYTDFKYLSNTAKQLTEEEALLGVSITGIMDNPAILLNPNIQKEMAEYAVVVNREWANKLYINPAARITTIKPEGTSSLVLGCGSGIHPQHAIEYIRRVQCNTDDNVYKHFAKHNKHAIEPSVWSAAKTDDVISFPLSILESAITKKDLTAVQHLEYIKSTQQNWVLPGSNIDTNKKHITHNVSCTVLVKDDEWTDVINYIYDNRQYFAAVSLLPAIGDKIYQQAPLEAVTTPEDKLKFDALVSSWKRVDYTTLKEDEDETEVQQNLACAGGVCELVT